MMLGSDTRGQTPGVGHLGSDPNGGQVENGAREASAESDRQTVSLLADMDVIVRELAEGVAGARR